MCVCVCVCVCVYIVPVLMCCVYRHCDAACLARYVATYIMIIRTVIAYVKMFITQMYKDCLICASLYTFVKCLRHVSNAAVMFLIKYRVATNISC